MVKEHFGLCKTMRHQVITPPWAAPHHPMGPASPTRRGKAGKCAEQGKKISFWECQGEGGEQDQTEGIPECLRTWAMGRVFKG